MLPTCLAAQRLPRNVLPEHYQLTLSPDLATATFGGELRLDVTVEVPSRAIVLNATELEIESIRVTSASGEWDAELEWRPAAEQVILHLPEALPVGRASIHARYQGTLNGDLRGFYLGQSQGKPYAGSQLEATNARRVFPSFDEPSFRTTYDITLVIGESLQAFSNGAEISSTPGPRPGLRTVRFARTPRIPSYLVALVVGDFACLEGEGGRVPTRVCADPSKLHLGRYALQVSSSVLAYFEDYYGIPYPFGKLDHIGIADFEAGAMENVGAVIYRESALLLDEATASVSQRRWVAAVVAHEVAHQWFGDLVTVAWWDDTWLKEGFANFMESKALDAFRPDWDLRVDDAADANWPLSSDKLASARAIRSRAETPAEIDSMFDGIAYGKTAAVLRMLETYLGEEVMRRGIQIYLTRNAFGSASAGAFMDALAEAADARVSPILDDFVSQPGLPVISVQSRCEGDLTVVELAQERFFAKPDAHGSAPEQVWQVPICFGPDECVLLRERRAHHRLPGCRDPLVANRNGRGYFVTRYSPADLARLRARLGALSPAERLVLVRDEWLLFQAGTRQADELMELLGTFQGERDKAVWGQILGAVETIDETLVMAGDRELFRAWVRDLLRPVARELGWSPRAGEPDRHRELRREVLAILGSAGADPQVLATAREMTEAVLRGDAGLDRDLAEAAVELAAQHGDGALYEAYLTALRLATDPEQYELWLGALSEFRRPELVQRTLELSLDPEIRNQDSARLVRGIMSSPQTVGQAWDFVRQRWSDVLAKMPEQSHPFLLPRVGRAFCDAERLDQLRSFAADKNQHAWEMKRTEEIVGNCMVLRAMHQERLAAWLRSEPGRGGLPGLAPHSR